MLRQIAMGVVSLMGLMGWVAPAAAAPQTPALLPSFSCAASDLTLGAGASFQQCSGFYDANLTNSAQSTFVQSVLNGLGITGYTLTGEKLDPTSPSSKFNQGSGLINFDTVLTGKTVIAVHQGSGATSGTAFYILDAGTSNLDQFTFNLSGLSNAQVYLTASPVPEPGTWSMLVAGLGAMGFVARRRRPAAA